MDGWITWNWGKPAKFTCLWFLVRNKTPQKKETAVYKKRKDKHECHFCMCDMLNQLSNEMFANVF